MLRILAAPLLLATIVPLAEAQCHGGRCSAPASYAVRYAPAPTAYQLADASGKLWRHADAAYLAAWVAEHDKTLVTASPQSVTPTPRAAATDAYGFGVILNRHRAQYYRKALAYDPALSAVAAANSSKGWGHHGLHHGRENVGMGPLDAVMASWLASPAHASALLDPNISRYGIAQVNGIWTFIGVR